MKWRALFLLPLLLACSSAPAQPARPVDPWKDFEFLLGEWSWAGGGQPGQATGQSAVRPELDGTVLVRRTHLEYPATKERAAFAHDDLLYFYRDPRDSSLRAIFFDNEGHVIEYRVAVAPDGKSIVSVSEAAPGGTTTRMTYAKAGSDAVTERFEIAPPGKPTEFAPYVEFTARRVRR